MNKEELLLLILLKMYYYKLLQSLLHKTIEKNKNSQLIFYL